MPYETLPQPDVLIAGAGIIGLTLALELEHRGAQVTVVDPQAALRQASFAAAGMLAAYDPHNAPELLALSELSLRRYPAFLERIRELSGMAVRFQTETTVQYYPAGPPQRLPEHSLDPRELAAALLCAVRASKVRLCEHQGWLEATATPAGLRVRTEHGEAFSPKQIVHASGAWFEGRHVILPRKGQMLRVRIPPSLSLDETHRSEHIYVVPRSHGPQAGTAILGATVEDAGFDTRLYERDLAHLRVLATELVPELADEAAAPQVEAWAGIRPATPDGLPLLGAHHPGGSQWIATGHFRNGILLAPATANVMADLLDGRPPAVDVSAFSPQRFGQH